MCGIGGFIAVNMSVRYKIYIARMLAYGLSARGTDSYGIVNENGTFFKAVNMDIRDFVNDSRFKEVVKKGTKIFIHTRYATKGKINIENCQPFFNEKYVLCHNGQIYGYGDHEHSDTKELFQKLSKESMEKVIKEADGWLALLIYSKKDRKIYAYKESSPLVYAYDDRQNLYFASTEEYLNILSVLGIRFSDIKKPKERELLKFSENGTLETTQKIAKIYPKWYGSGGSVWKENKELKHNTKAEEWLSEFDGMKDGEWENRYMWE